MKKFGVVTFGSGQLQIKNMKLRVPEKIGQNRISEDRRKTSFQLPAHLAERIYMTGFYCMGLFLLLKLVRSKEK